MPVPPKQIEERINTFIQAWETLRPTKSFSGMTLEQFKLKLKPSLTARTAIASLEQQLQAAINDRDIADRAGAATLSLVVNAIRGDPEEGEDSPLYEALGYVRKSERKSGLRRPRKSDPLSPVAKAA
jgi:hypothetical protein